MDNKYMNLYLVTAPSMTDILGRKQYAEVVWAETEKKAIDVVVAMHSPDVGIATVKLIPDKHVEVRKDLNTAVNLCLQLLKRHARQLFNVGGNLAYLGNATRYDKEDIRPCRNAAAQA
jgi:hypothetical protein